MTQMNKYLTGAVLMGALALTGSSLVGASLANAEPSKPAARCFYSNDWESWKATDQHTMYVSVSGRRVFRLDFASSCQAMTWPDTHLITVFRGGNSICSPLDIDLKVSDSNGFAEPCIVSGLTELTPDQIAALPKTSRP
jgi:hypothetical protein